MIYPSFGGKPLAPGKCFKVESPIVLLSFSLFAFGYHCYLLDSDWHLSIMELLKGIDVRECSRPTTILQMRNRELFGQAFDSFYNLQPHNVF